MPPTDLLTIVSCRTYRRWDQRSLLPEKNGQRRQAIDMCRLYHNGFNCRTATSGSQSALSKRRRLLRKRAGRPTRTRRMRSGRSACLTASITATATRATWSNAISAKRGFIRNMPARTTATSSEFGHVRPAVHCQSCWSRCLFASRNPTGKLVALVGEQRKERR